jgi:hypothetical protein
MNPIIKKTLVASSVALALGTATAQAALMTNLYGPYNWSTTAANFTMLDPAGYVVGGTNDVNMVWDGNGYSSDTDYTGAGSSANVTASSTTAFFGPGLFWTAHDIQVFVPGTYNFNSTTTTSDGESGTLTMVIGAGQLGMHMLFDWNGSYNIDVVVVATPGAVFGAGIGLLANPGCASTAPGSTLTNCLYDGHAWDFQDTGAQPLASNPWMLTSVDQAGGDGIAGTPMPSGGPFQFFNANFMANLSPTPDAVVPVPAAAWLFGSGLMGLAAVARRKKKA